MSIHLHIFLIIIIKILINTIHTQTSDCFISTFSTTKTQCDIKFKICSNKLQQKKQNQKTNSQTNSFNSQISYIMNDTPNEAIFQSCQRRKCLRNLINGQCRLQQYYDLNQQTCFKQCCGYSNKFSPQSCIQYNQVFQQIQSNQNTILIIFLSGCFGLIILTLTIFLVYKIDFFKKSKSDTQLSQTKRKKSLWKKVNGYEITGLNKCQCCKLDQAFIETECNHWFHLNCLKKQIINKECPRCFNRLNLTSLKVYCQFCWKKYFKILFKGTTHLKNYIDEAYEQHIQDCIKQDKLDQPSTDVRFSNASRP